MAPRFSKNGKRLGRPPKNETGVTFNISAPQAQAEAPPPLTIEFNPETMIECQFIPVPQHVLTKIDGAPEKEGFYTSSNFKFDERDFDKWPALAYLKADFDKYRASEIPDSEILHRCINYLNALDLKKKQGKKDLEPKYGKLSLSKEEIKFTKKFGYECAILIFCTSDRKSDYFWGSGERA